MLPPQLREIVAESKELFHCAKAYLSKAHITDKRIRLKYEGELRSVMDDDAVFPVNLVYKALRHGNIYRKKLSEKHRTNWDSPLGRPYVKLAYEAVRDNRKVELPPVEDFEDPLAGADQFTIYKNTNSPPRTKNIVSYTPCSP